MLHRFHRITFRLTGKEHELFAPLVKQLHAWTWSDLVRMALRQLAAAEGKATSDNGVRHADRVSDNKEDVGKWLAAFPVRKRSKGGKSRKK